MDGPARARLDRSFNGSFRQEMLDYTPLSHQPIVDATTDGDPERALAVVKRHILEVRDLIEKGVRQRAPETEPQAHRS